MSNMKCENCIHYESNKPNRGYCNKLSRKGEQEEAQELGAAAWDNFWVREDFFCALFESDSANKLGD